MAKVSIAKTGDSFDMAFTRVINDIGERLITSGDHVLVKLNLVQSVSPDSGQTTNPKLIEAGL